MSRAYALTCEEIVKTTPLTNKRDKGMFPHPLPTEANSCTKNQCH